MHCAAVQPGIQMNEGVRGEGVAPEATLACKKMLFAQGARINGEEFLGIFFFNQKVKVNLVKCFVCTKHCWFSLSILHLLLFYICQN